MGQHILCNDEEVGKWLGSLIETYGDVRNMSALHGEDYQDLLNERQETVQAELCKEVFIERNVDYIKALTLYEMYKLRVRRDNPATKPLKKSNFYVFVTRWLVKNTTDYHVHIQAVQWIMHAKQTSAKVIKKQNLGTQLENNDDDFIEKDERNNGSLVEW